MNISQTTINYSNAIADGSNIFAIDMMGNRSCIGVTVECYAQMKKTAEIAADMAEKFASEKDEYFEALVNAGLRTRPKTQDEINSDLQAKNAEIQEQNAQLLQAVLDLTKQVEGLTNGYNADCKANGSKARNSKASTGESD